MVNENSLVNADIVDRSPQATDQSLKLEKTTSPRSPQTQKCDIKLEEINDDNRQIHTIYQFQNCGTVNLSIDSFNASGVRMENCGNNVPQVTNYHRVSGNEKSDENPHSQPHGVSSDVPPISTDQPPQNGLGYIMPVLLLIGLLIFSRLIVFIMDLYHLRDVGGMNVGGLL